MALSGHRGEAEQIIHSLIDTRKSRFIPPFTIAIVYAALGESESALLWLEKGYEARDVGMLFLPIDPKWNALRSNPRFQALLRRCNFVIPH